MAVKFFDEQWYLTRNPDVAQAVSAGTMTAEQHFEQYGVHEGRSPSPLFDADFYLSKNPDVFYAVQFGLTTPYEHFVTHGHTEGRQASPYFDVDNYLATNSDVADVVESGAMSAYEHFQQYGAAEDRSPLSSFNAAYYAAENPDLADAIESGQINATRHFLTYGVNEGRSTNPVIAIGAYLAANEDVANAVEDGLITAHEHLLTYGVLEGRDLGNGVSGADFAGDPVYQQAVAQGNGDAALARMTEVAPFLPGFEAPDDFELPADWPIPQDFQGAQLQVPEGWTPSQPVQLPESFAQPFTITFSDAGVSFGAVEGEIRLINEDGEGAFAQGGFIAAGRVPLDGTTAVTLASGQTLVGAHADIGELIVLGEGTVRAEGTAEADTIDATEWNVVNLIIDAKEGDDTITITDWQTAIGGEGADSFVIQTDPNTEKVIRVADYSHEQGDSIDLSQIEGLNPFGMEVRGAEHNGTGWDWDGYSGNSLGVWLTPENASIQITDARDQSVKFTLADVEGFEGYNTLQVNISNGGVLRAGSEMEVLRGGSGSQVLIGGEAADIMSGGGGNDFYVLSNSTSRLDSMDRIVDLEIGADTVVGNTLITGGSFVNGGNLQNLNAESISGVLTAEAFGANAGAYFTVGAVPPGDDPVADPGSAGRTFIVLNDGVAGYQAANDTIVEVWNVDGDLANLSVVGLPQFESTMPTL